MNRQCMRSWGLIFLTTVILNLLLTWILTFSGVHGIPNPTHARWPGAVPPLWPHPGESGAVAVAYEQRGLGTHVRDIEVAPDHHRNVIHRAVRIDYGLPLRCMSVEFQRVIDRRVTPPAVVDVELPLRSGIRLHAAGKPWPDHQYVLPLKPIWFGMLFNVLVLSAAGGLIMHVVRRAIRSDRQRKGRCIQCGHPLAGQSTCPECGETLPVQ